MAPKGMLSLCQQGMKPSRVIVDVLPEKQRFVRSSKYSREEGRCSSAGSWFHRVGATAKKV